MLRPARFPVMFSNKDFGLLHATVSPKVRQMAREHYQIDGSALVPAGMSKRIEPEIGLREVLEAVEETFHEPD
jgi:hypothetical protein